MGDVDVEDGEGGVGLRLNKSWSEQCGENYKDEWMNDDDDDDDDVDDDDDDDDESSWWKGRGARKWRFYQPKRPKYPFMAPRLCLKLVFIVWDSIYFLKHRIEYGVQDKSNMMVRHISYHIIYHIYQSKAEDVKGWQILTCLERSSAELMGATMRSTVRKAARLAVYEEIKIKEKNHQTPPGRRQAKIIHFESTKFIILLISFVSDEKLNERRENVLTVQ